MSGNDLTIPQRGSALELSPFGKSPAMKLEMDSIREAESRYVEAKTVNPITYSDLEHTFNQSYRDIKRHLSTIGYHLTLAEKALREASANVILGAYAEHMIGKPKYQDNAHLRDAFLMRDPDYVGALDRINQLKALQSNFEGKMKVVENVCKYMRQKMYLISKSGMDPNLYVTSGDDHGKR
jgi:hypothetical protein